MPLTAFTSEVSKTILQNGLTVVSENIPAYRSVAVGIWVKTGSRFESFSQKGLVHFIEHMLFKGTTSRTALDIAQSLERYGGQLNAFTAKEETCFYIHTIDSQLEQGLEILADMICNPLFKNDDIELEKQVVFEEIGSVHDTPEEYIFDLFQEKIYPDQPMGFPILGDHESVRSFNRPAIQRFWKDYYRPANIVLAVAGNVEHNRLTDLAAKFFTFEDPVLFARAEDAKAAHNVDYNCYKAVNQAHICIGNEAVSYYHDNRYDFMALSAYLGGGLSSKLFQVLREELGYVYSVYSFIDFYKDSGIFGFYLGTDLRNRDKAIDRLRSELDGLASQALDNELVAMLKDQLKGRFLLSQESSLKRMTRLAKNEIYYGKYLDDTVVINSINKISSDSLFDVTQKYIRPENFSKVVISPGKN